MSRNRERNDFRLAVTLGGGGARAAYQVGVLRAIASRHPTLQIPLLTGVSAGAINVSHLASFEGSLIDSAEALTDLWLKLKLDCVFRTNGAALLWRAAKVGMRLSVGLPRFLEPVHGMVDTRPLRNYLRQALHTSDGSLPGIDRNIANGQLQGVALTANSYGTGNTVTFFTGREIQEWERPRRRGVETRLTVEHVMASSALPLVFPPVLIDNMWYGDGGVRLMAPLAPPVHMGADRLLVISTHFGGIEESADDEIGNAGRTDLPKARGQAASDQTSAAVEQQALLPDPPSPATVLASMYNSMFFDQMDQDIHFLDRTNCLLSHVDMEHRNGLREIDLLVIQPSEDLGALAIELQDRIPPAFRFLLDRFGSGQSASDGFVSTMLFHPDYVRRLIEIGERDGHTRATEIAAFLS